MSNKSGVFTIGNAPAAEFQEVELRERRASFNTALEICGFGKFHYNLLGANALCLLAAGVQMGLMAYVLPSAKCELELTSSQMGFINASFLIGGCISAFLWGILADTNLGRRKILVFTLFLDAVSTMYASFFAYNPTLLEITRFFNGFLIGAPGTLTFSYVGEFHTESLRAKVLCYMGFFFTFSWILLPIVAWIIIPIPIDWTFGPMVFSSWRLFMSLSGILSFVAALWMYTLPPSPKLLYTHGKNAEALAVLQTIWRVNKNRSVREYPVKALISEKIELKEGNPTDQGENSHIQKLPANHDAEVTVSGQLYRLLQEIALQFKTLARPPWLTYMVLTTFLLFANMFGYYGLGLWIPEIFTRFDAYYKDHPNVTVTVCELNNVKPVAALPIFNFTETYLTTLSPVEQRLGQDFEVTSTNRCENTVDFGVYKNTVIVGVFCLIGNILSGIFSGYFKDRRILPITTALLGGIAVGFIYITVNKMQYLAAATLFQASMATGNMVLNSVIVDIFPTQVSALAICTATFAGRVGAIISNTVFGLLLDVSCEIPMLLVGLCSLVGGLLSFLIPVGNVSNIKENLKSEFEQKRTNAGVI